MPIACGNICKVNNHYYIFSNFMQKQIIKTINFFIFLHAISRLNLTYRPPLGLYTVNVLMSHNTLSNIQL